MLKKLETSTRDKLCLELREKLQALITSEDSKSKQGTELNFCAQKASSKEQSLFNQFFSTSYHSILRDESYLFNNELLFIQNVPRMDFYRESTFGNERKEQNLLELQNVFLNALKEVTSYDLEEEVHFNLLFNLFNFCLRLGIDRKYLSSIKPVIKNEVIALRLELLCLICKVSEEISNNEEVSKINLEELMLLADRTQKHQLLFCVVINRLIVSFSRYYEEDNELEQKIISYVGNAKNKLKELDPKTNKELLTVSMIYRGFPMANSFTIEERREFLKQSQLCVDNLSEESNLDKILKEEINFTLNLTCFKFEFYSGSREQAQIHLNTCLKLDPFNSAIFTEIGLVSMKEEQFSKAQDAFKKATLLGAPNLSMNYFFLGKSSNEIGLTQDCVEAYEKSLYYDELAISPLLELIDLEVDKKDEFVALIKNTPDLYEQLTDEERCTLKI